MIAEALSRMRALASDDRGVASVQPGAHLSEGGTHGLDVLLLGPVEIHFVLVRNQSHFRLLSLHPGGYAPDHVPRDVSGDLGVLLETPTRVLVPVLPEGHVDPELVPGPDEDAPQLFVYPEEHLELVAVLGDFELVDEPEGVPDQELVVRRYADVDAASQQLVEQEDVVLSDRVEVLVGYGP